LYLDHRYRLPLLQFQLLRRAQLDSDYRHPPPGIRADKDKDIVEGKKEKLAQEETNCLMSFI
jgi:hypothetical protein